VPAYSAGEMQHLRHLPSRLAPGSRPGQCKRDRDAVGSNDEVAFGRAECGVEIEREPVAGLHYGGGIGGACGVFFLPNRLMPPPLGA
jgi:hypothetical protein